MSCSDLWWERGSSLVGEREFAHPAERELTRVFDEHGIRWEYEPCTFVLSRNPDGSVKEAFTPDFFLPGQGCTSSSP
jgi:hypothetical protein